MKTFQAITNVTSCQNCPHRDDNPYTHCSKAQHSGKEVYLQNRTQLTESCPTWSKSLKEKLKVPLGYLWINNDGTLDDDWLLMPDPVICGDGGDENTGQVVEVIVELIKKTT